MIKNRNDIELLAPAGSFDTMTAAAQGKADAVYFGVGALNMRAKAATNFTIPDLPKVAQFCKEHNLKTYLTVNTVIYDEDFEEMEATILAAKDAGIDALIVSDMAAATFAIEHGIKIHASTQLNISNIRAVEYNSKFYDVMVLARELKLEQVKNIARQIDERNILGPGGEKVKLEVFAHGALCMAISGKCYLSVHLQDKSANRGACLQPCRRKYEVTEKEYGYGLELENEYIMSPKDLSTIGFLDKILDAGVRILKIEGRGRPAEYVKRVCQCYNEAIQAYLDNDYTEARISDWNKRLSEVFNRGYWDGYYLGQTLGEWNDRHGSKATKRKVYTGIVTNYFNKIGVAEVTVQTGEIKIGDEVLITGSTTGAVELIVEEMRIDDSIIEIAPKGTVVAFKTSELVRRNDKVFVVIDSAEREVEGD